MSSRLKQRQILSAVAIFAFVGIFFVVPLWTALSLCTMPCCHHQSGPAGTLAGAMAGCHTECAVVAADDALAASTVVVPAHDAGVTAPAVAIVAAVRPALVAGPSIAAPPASGIGAPIHLLNSVFRI